MGPVFGSNGLGDIRFGYYLPYAQTQDLGSVRMNAAGAPPATAVFLTPAAIDSQPSGKQNPFIFQTFTPSLASERTIFTQHGDSFTRTAASPTTPAEPVDHQGGFLGRLYRTARTSAENAWNALVDMFSWNRPHEHTNW